MSNSHMPAMPIEISGFGQYAPEIFTGLTKREMIAMHAMSGMLSNIEYADLYETTDGWVKNVTEASVEFADALLKELDKKEE